MSCPGPCTAGGPGGQAKLQGHSLPFTRDNMEASALTRPLSTSEPGLGLFLPEPGRSVARYGPGRQKRHQESTWKDQDGISPIKMLQKCAFNSQKLSGSKELTNPLCRG